MVSQEKRNFDMHADSMKAMQDFINVFIFTSQLLSLCKNTEIRGIIYEKGNGLQTGKAHMLSFNLVEKATVSNVN